MDPKSIPAYPVTEANGSNDGQPGMLLRDHFAGLAMQGLLSANATYGGKEDRHKLATDAWAHADAMLAAR